MSTLYIKFTRYGDTVSPSFDYLAQDNDPPPRRHYHNPGMDFRISHLSVPLTVIQAAMPTFPFVQFAHLSVAVFVISWSGTLGIVRGLSPLGCRCNGRIWGAGAATVGGSASGIWELAFYTFTSFW